MYWFVAAKNLLQATRYQAPDARYFANITKSPDEKLMFPFAFIHFIALEVLCCMTLSLYIRRSSTITYHFSSVIVEILISAKLLYSHPMPVSLDQPLGDAQDRLAGVKISQIEPFRPLWRMKAAVRTESRRIAYIIIIRISSKDITHNYKLRRNAYRHFCAFKESPLELYSTGWYHKCYKLQSSN